MLDLDLSRQDMRIASILIMQHLGGRDDCGYGDGLIHLKKTNPGISIG